MGNSKKILIASLAVVLILGFFVMIRSANTKSAVLKNITKIIPDSRYTIFYGGDINKDSKDEFKRIMKEYNVKIYTLDDDKSEVIKFVKAQDTNSNIKDDTRFVYMIYDNSKFLGYIDDSMNIDEYIRKYIYDELPTAERLYKVATGAQYASLYNSKDTMITVFGEDGCSYCKQLEKVINEISKRKLYDIYYMNFSRLSDDDQDIIYDLNIKIPKECTKDKISDVSLVEGYSKPTTIVSKNGKILGCIKGYYDYNVYVAKLKAILEG